MRLARPPKVAYGPTFIFGMPQSETPINYLPTSKQGAIQDLKGPASYDLLKAFHDNQNRMGCAASKNFRSRQYTAIPGDEVNSVALNNYHSSVRKGHWKSGDLKSKVSRLNRTQVIDGRMWFY